MRTLTAILTILSIGLFSCQKEVDDIFSNNGNGGGNGNTSGLLTKLTSKTGSDSAVMNFFYNSSKKLIAFNTDVISGGFTVSVSERAERNAQGIIQKVIYKSDEYQQLGLDSVTSIIKSAGGRYIAEVTEFDLGGIIVMDSIALIYDGSGKVVREETYLEFMGLSELTGKTEYTYSGNNLATMKNYSWDGSDFTLEETFNYDQYDTKLNPMYFGNDAFVFGSPLFISSNNPIKSSQSDASGASFNFTTTYTYNSANKPVSGTSVVDPGGETSIGNYYYQ